MENALSIGKAGEHIACADLLLQGYEAYLSDQGLPYDIVVDLGSTLLRVQVKSTQGLFSCSRVKNIYRFGTRRAKGNRTRFDAKTIDCFAFVALDIREVAYIPIEEMVARTGSIKQTVDFKSRRVTYKKRVYSNGTIRSDDLGKYLEDFKEFNYGKI